MKYLAATLLIVVLTTTGASAQILFAPDFSSGSTPSGFASNTAGGGTITYSSNTMITGDLATNGAQAYISSSVADPAASTITTQFTFTPNYSADQANGQQATLTFFELDTTNANNPVVRLNFHPLGFGLNQINLDLGGGIAFGGGDQSASTAVEYSKTPMNFLAGDTLTFNLVTTFSDSGGMATNSTTGTVSDSTGTLYTFNFSTTGSDNGGSFDPVNNPLTLKLGMLNSDNDGVIASGSNFTFSNVSLVAGAVPEPSTYALLGVGLVAIVFAARRRSAV